MSIFLNTNVSARNAQRQLLDSSNALDKPYERLSSKSRTNSVADDAAGLRISERLTSQIDGMGQAIRNANDAISLTHTAEDALGETTRSLLGIRQFATQSQNGINSASTRNALNSDVSTLKREILRITTTRCASTAIDTTDAVLPAPVQLRADLEVSKNRFQSSIRNLSNVNENLSSARSRIMDSDFTAETENLTKNQILQQVSLAVLSQAANRPQATLSLLN